MLIKVCGIKYQDNLDQVSQLDIDMIGLNFFKKSARYTSDNLNTTGISKDLVGVFVDEDVETILKVSRQFNLKYAQLHGTETPEMCKNLSKKLGVIKVFSVSEPEDLQDTSAYWQHCDYFIFDTRTPTFGGSGKKFNWNLLPAYNGEIPFLLAGGISPDDIEEVSNIKHPMFAGVDINSRFEVKPGLKNINSIQAFIKKIR